MNKNLKKCLLVMVLLAVFALPNFSRAQTVADLQAQIQALLAQVQQLQAQLAQLQGGTTTWCHTFNTNLWVGASGSEVTALQTALQKDGESVSMTGTFDDQTASTVTGFQEKYASQILTLHGLQHGTGYVGSATRAKLNALYGCGTTTSSSPSAITVISPSAGDSLKQGSQYTVNWLALGPVNISLLQNSTYLTQIASNVPNTGSYAWTVPTSYSGSGFQIQVSAVGYLPGTSGSFSIVAANLTPSSSPTISPSSFNFSAQQGGSNPPSQTLFITPPLGSLQIGWQLSWSCTNSPCGWLSIGSLFNSQVPVTVNISGLAAGTYQGNFRVLDPNYMDPSYHVYQTIPVTLIVSAPFQPPTVTPSLSLLLASDSPSGQIAAGTSTSYVASLFKFVLQSNAAESLKVNSIAINVNDSLVSASQFNGFTLFDSNGAQIGGSLVPSGTNGIMSLVFNFSTQYVIPQGSSATFTLKAGMNSAQLYPTIVNSTAQFSISSNGIAALGATSNMVATQNGSANGSLLTIVSSIVPTPAAIQLTSPIGGEQWQAGKTYQITWTSTGFPANTPLQILFYDTRYGLSYDVLMLDTITTMGAGSYTVALPLSAPIGNTYSVQIHNVTSPLGISTSQSAPFSIVAASSSGTTTPSIHLSGSSGSQVSDSSISVNIGDTFTISGIPQNLQGLSYWFGSGYPPSGYFNRAYFFNQSFGNNNLCGNNDAPVNGTWTMTCTAKVPGSSAFYVEIYANGQTYRSNSVYVTIATTQPLVDLKINGSDGPISAAAGSNLNLTWISSNVTSCYPQGNWSGTIATSGNQTLIAQSPSVVTGYLYTVACYTQSGSIIQDGVQVNVSPAPITSPSVTVSTDSSNPPAAQVIMGSTGNQLGAYRFTETSNSESVKVTNMQVLDSTPSSNKAAFTNLQFWSGATLMGTAGAAQAVSGGYLYTFTFATPIVVPQAGSLTVSLRGDVASYPSSGATDNSVHVFQISQATALGVSSNVAITPTLQSPSGNPQTVLRTKLSVSATGLGATSGRGKISSDQLGTIILSANSANSAAVNTLTVTFSGTAPNNPNFLDGVKLLDENNNSIGVALVPASCNGSNTCTKTWNFGSTTNGQGVSAGATRIWTLVVDSTKTWIATSGSATLMATINAPTDISYTDGLDPAVASGINLPANTPPIQINSVSYAALTQNGSPDNISAVFSVPDQATRVQVASLLDSMRLMLEKILGSLR